MRPLLINADTRAALDRLRRHAEANPIPLAVLMRMLSKAHPPPGDDPRHVAELPDGGWRIVFTVEDQPSGRVRHASVSHSGRHRGKGPNPAAVGVICALLGFDLDERMELDGEKHLLQPDPDLGWLAPNVFERVEP